MRPLTDKQQSFVEEYLVDLNATQAAIRAGYSEHTARVIGPENLSKPAVAEAIAAAQAKRSQETGITAAWVLTRIKLEAEREGEGSSHSARVSAVALAAKHLGMIDDRVRVEGEIVSVTEVVVRTREEAAALMSSTNGRH